MLTHLHEVPWGIWPPPPTAVHLIETCRLSHPRLAVEVSQKVPECLLPSVYASCFCVVSMCEKMCALHVFTCQDVLCVCFGGSAFVYVHLCGACVYLREDT